MVRTTSSIRFRRLKLQSTLLLEVNLGKRMTRPRRADILGTT